MFTVGYVLRIESLLNLVSSSAHLGEGVGLVVDVLWLVCVLIVGGRFVLYGFSVVLLLGVVIVFAVVAVLLHRACATALVCWQGVQVGWRTRPSARSDRETRVSSSIAW